ncbi:MAG: hypothetical protein ABFS45_26335 [Pseudomonadota bacterium]
MARILINDLEESVVLDRKAMRLLGGGQSRVSRRSRTRILRWGGVGKAGRAQARRFIPPWPFLFNDGKWDGS